MKKHVLIISSSPRIGGNSDVLCDELARGAADAGHHTTKFNLQKLDIKPCIGCEHCHIKSKGICVHKDDMQQIFEVMAKADVLVMASPVYFYDVCAQLKIFIDRTYSKFYTQMEVFNFKEAVFISTCEAGPSVFEIPVALYRNYISSFSAVSSLPAVKNRGELLVSGVHGKGEVPADKKQAAYQLGKNL